MYPLFSSQLILCIHGYLASSRISDKNANVDNNGNTQVHTGQSVSFDPESRMTRWGSVLTCGYNGDGQRAWKQNASGARTFFVYDGSQPVCELNSNGTVAAVTDFGADGVWARHTTTTDWFYTFDPQGGLSQKIGRDGSVLCSSLYDAQGHEATTDTHPDPFSGFGGQWGYYADWETSTTGGGSCLYLLGHRFYDPDAGRFINRDPIRYNGGINLYAYTGNDPVNEVDPEGLYPVGGPDGNYPMVPTHWPLVPPNIPGGPYKWYDNRDGNSRGGEYRGPYQKGHPVGGNNGRSSLTYNDKTRYWKCTGPKGPKIYFNQNGYPVSSGEAHGNPTSKRYGGSGRGTGADGYRGSGGFGRGGSSPPGEGAEGGFGGEVEFPGESPSSGGGKDMNFP